MFIKSRACPSACLRTQRWVLCLTLTEEVWHSEPPGSGYLVLFSMPCLCSDPCPWSRDGECPLLLAVEAPPPPATPAVQMRGWLGAGHLPGLRSCSSCLEIQIAANVSSPERNYGWQFQCFSCFDAPVCFKRRGEGSEGIELGPP